MPQAKDTHGQLHVIEPEPDGRCSDECPAHDGKRCRVLGARPGEVCEAVPVLKIIPDAEGLWLWFDGSDRGRPVLVHDPTGDGLQFDSGAFRAETNLAAYDWAGRLVVEGSKFAARGQAAEQLRAALRDLAASYIIAACESSGAIEPGEWDDAFGHLDLVLSRLGAPLADTAPTGVIPALVALGIAPASAGADDRGHPDSSLLAVVRSVDGVARAEATVDSVAVGNPITVRFTGSASVEHVTAAIHDGVSQLTAARVEVIKDEDVEQTRATIPDSEGHWLLDNGPGHGVALLVHDPTMDGLQFDWDGNASNTDLAAYTWRGRLVVEGPKIADILLESLAAKVDAMRAALLERGHTDECSSWKVADFDGGDQECDCSLAALTNSPRRGVAESVDATFEGGRVGVSCLDSAEYLNATPTGGRRSVTETSGDESLTFEDDRRLPAASEADASELAKLEALVSKMIDGNFGAGNFIIGGHKVIVADPRYMTAVYGGINVTTSQAPRTGGE